MNKLRAFLSTLNERGLGHTLAILVSYGADYAFDARYRTDTRSWVGLPSLSIDSANKQRGQMYQPTLALPLEQLFRKLRLPVDGVLVDLGAGKGRVLLIAASHGFPVVRGVEFSPELCRIAMHNCTVYKAKTHVAATFEIIESDVVDYTVRDDDKVFFMFNPFDGEILGCVLQNIKASLHDRPRPVWIIYRNAVHKAIIESDPAFEKHGSYVLWGLDFSIYRSASGLRTRATNELGVLASAGLIVASDLD